MGKITRLVVPRGVADVESRANCRFPQNNCSTGTIIVHPPITTTDGGVALYARVSSADQKPDLERQVARCAVYAAEHRLRVTEVIKEIGSGLNGHRRGLMRLLRMPTVTTVVVEHRDRLMRFGFEYVEAALMAQGRTVVVIDSAEVQDDLVRDVTEVLTSLCARLYGQRAAANRAKRALEAMSMRIVMSHRIELKPTKIQEALFGQCVGASRFAYNWALAEWQRQFAAGEKPNEAALRRQFNAIKPVEFPWILDLPKSVPQQAIKNVGRAYQRFFPKTIQVPAFQKTRRSRFSPAG
jgi:putative resolvase